MKFFIPTKVIFGPGSVHDIKSIVEEEFPSKKYFLVTDEGVRSAGLTGKVESQLLISSFLHNILCDYIFSPDLFVFDHKVSL